MRTSNINFVRKSFIWLGTGIAAAALLLFLIAFLHTFLEQKRAERLLSIVTGLAVGKTAESAAMESVRPFFTGVSSVENQAAETNYVSATFDNKDLARLRLSNYRFFAIVLSFHDHILAEKRAIFFVEHDCTIRVVERTREEANVTQEQDPNYRSHFSTIPSGYPWPVNEATIIDDDSYPEPLRNRDWRFNLGQLTHFGGCSDARAILPAI